MLPILIPRLVDRHYVLFLVLARSAPFHAHLSPEDSPFVHIQSNCRPLCMDSHLDLGNGESTPSGEP